MSIKLPENYDVIIIGGSYAGMSAAMQLARARKHVLIIDTGVRRNRFVEISHTFLGQDGNSPDVIAAQCREQVLAYPTVHILQDEAIAAQQTNSGFQVETLRHGAYQSRKLILACGVADELPSIEGMAERWGKGVSPCPYCHGYEMNLGAVGVFGTDMAAFNLALLLPDWGQVTFFTFAMFQLDTAQRAVLAARNITLEPARILRMTDVATVELSDGRNIVLNGLFVTAKTRITCPIPAQLGCEVIRGPLGQFIHTDNTQATSVRGVYACGDAARPGTRFVAMAIADGARAGIAAHHALAHEVT